MSPGDDVMYIHEPTKLYPLYKIKEIRYNDNEKPELHFYNYSGWFHACCYMTIQDILNRKINE